MLRMGCEKLLGRMDNALPLACRDAAECAAELGGASGAHLDKHQHRSLQHDQVQFAAFGAPIARQHLQALSLQPCKRLVLGGGTSFRGEEALEQAHGLIGIASIGWLTAAGAADLPLSGDLPWALP